MSQEMDADRRWREGVELQERMHRVEERFVQSLREEAARLAAAPPRPRLACPVCKREDVTVKKDGTLRAHVDAQLLGSSFMQPDSGRCKGSGQKPKEG